MSSPPTGKNIRKRGTSFFDPVQCNEYISHPKAIKHPVYVHTWPFIHYHDIPFDPKTFLSREQRTCCTSMTMSPSLWNKKGERRPYVSPWDISKTCTPSAAYAMCRVFLALPCFWNFTRNTLSQSHLRLDIKIDNSLPVAVAAASIIVYFYHPLPIQPRIQQ